MARPCWSGQLSAIARVLDLTTITFVDVCHELITTGALVRS